MKKIISLIMIMTMIVIYFTSCEPKEKEEAPAIPPKESMAFNLDNFKVEAQTSLQSLALKNTLDTTTAAWQCASGNVGFWNLILTGTLVVPVRAFFASFTQQPVFLGDATWQWSYSVNVMGGVYQARLVGKVNDEDVSWEMYIAKTGIGGFPEFLWFEGTSDLDGNGGEWILYHSYTFQEEVLTIDWSRTNDEIGQITFTNVRIFNDDRTTNLFNGSYIQAGLQEGVLDAYYTIHIYDIFTTNFIDVNIEWSTTAYNGRVKSEPRFGDNEWHCWDNYGYDLPDCD